MKKNSAAGNARSGKAPRRDHDNYPTPLDCAIAITKRVAEVVGPKRYLYEPSAGDEASFVKAFRVVYPTASITAIDVRPEARLPCMEAGAQCFYQDDYFHHLGVEGGFMDHSLIAGNPPFSMALEFVLATLDVLPVGSHLAFLLNLRMHAGVERNERLWSRRNLLAWFALAQRPQFIKNGSDNNDYGVFIWEGGYQGNAMTLPSLNWKQPKPQKPQSSGPSPALP